MNLYFKVEEICYIPVRVKMSECKWKYFETHDKPSDRSVPFDLILNRQLRHPLDVDLWMQPVLNGGLLSIFCTRKLTFYY
jgi:hypothetical protein